VIDIRLRHSNKASAKIGCCHSGALPAERGKFVSNESAGGANQKSGFIHPTAIVDSGATFGADVRIGPLCHVGPDVVLGDNVELKSHVVVHGHTNIGARTRIFPFASIGHEPQDLKFHGEHSTLTIGHDCMIREGVTMNPGTEGGGGKTVVGNHCTMLANSHVAHDCNVGDHVILSNNVMLAGHTSIGQFVIMGGGSAVHQFVRIGDHAFVGGLAGVENDVIPYGMALGNRAGLAGLNLVGLRRRGFSRESIHDLRRAYRLLFAAEGTLKERLADVADEFSSHPQVHEILDFIHAGGDRALCVPRDTKDGAS
jgi:UDP-N-acetylglucosamine acyltransferase